MIRAILDTNLWISFLISKKLRRIENHFGSKTIKLVFSEELLSEFVEVARRPKLKRYFPPESVDELIAIFDFYGEMVEVTSTVNVCVDSDDNYLLALAKDGKADFLVTGDNDLLQIKKFGKTRILKYADFEKAIGIV